ncbi:MAG: hypothetical protein MJ246_08000 [Clostridia bacterium]|nr:hypothetical protein [Clostridia bacterium]
MKKFFKALLIILAVVLVYLYFNDIANEESKIQEEETVKENQIVTDISDDDVIKLFKKAEEASYWFRVCSLEEGGYDPESGLSIVGRFKTLEEMKDYLKVLFSEELIDEFISNSRYEDVDGVLMVMAGARGTNIFMRDSTYEVVRLSDKKIKLIETVDVLDETLENHDHYESFDFLLEKINGSWVFTVFPTVR